MILLGIFSILYDQSIYKIRPTAAPPQDQSVNPANAQQFIQTATSENNAVLSEAQIAQQSRLTDAVAREQAMVPVILPDRTKQFTLTASVFLWNLYVGQTVSAWGYNGQVPGPLIRVKVGDRIRVVLKNQLPDATTIHWHGLAVPNDMDGIPNMPRPPIQPGESFAYEFTITEQMIGTHYYHSHYNDDFQVDSGLYGTMIIDPAEPTKSKEDVDAMVMLSSWKINGSDLENVFSIDGKPYPNAPQITVKKGQRVRLRFINASAEEFHTMHLHGYTYEVVARDGNPLAQPEKLNTLSIGPGETADVSFIANNPGDWMLHCHILDHTVNIDDDLDDMGGLVSFIHVK